MNKRWVAIGAVLGSVSIAALLVGGGLRINTTESMPRGLWWATHFDGTAHRGDIVAVCLPATSFIQRYIPSGPCSNGLEPVLKIIQAIPGDIVVMDPSGAQVNGLSLANTAPLKEDEQGRELFAWPFDTYIVAPGEVYLFSTHSPRSFDSRYLGPIAIKTIIARGVPLLVW